MSSLFVAGKWVSTEQRKQVVNPWDLSTIDDVSQADEAIVEAAVASAFGAIRSLRATSTFQRRQWIDALGQLLERDSEEVALIIASEAGKPITLARAEVQRAIQTFRLGSEECARLGGDVLHLDTTRLFAGAVGGWTRVSSGVLLAITPFNFPLNLVAHKLAPAFALGMPVVLKPAPQTPLTALKLAALAEEAGIPEGLLSVLPCSNALAQSMVEDSRFSAVSFTGSATVGWQLKALARKKRVLLELGGNASVVIAPDAQLEKLIQPLVNAAFAYAGQVCVKAQRVFVHRSMLDSFLERLLERVRSLHAESPLEPSTLCGPLIDQPSADRVRRWVQEAVSHGATIACGMTGESNRVDPAVVLNAHRGMLLVDEELFGPVLTVHPYDTLEECFSEIEEGNYGLQCGLFTDSVNTIRQAYASLSVGALIVNDATSFRVDSMPYGGVKDSGLGREGVRFAIDELAEKKLLVLR